MKLNLQDIIFTPQDLRALTMEVRRYGRWFAQESVKAKVTGKATTEPFAVSEAAASVIHEYAAGQAITGKLLDSLIVELDNLEKTLPHVTITLAAMPGNLLKKTLTNWCRKNISPEILVDFRFNATLLGGMVVQHGSRIHDWSFRRMILANRAKFPEVLRHV
ncbi:MAG: atpH [Candidatus Saccharibacteria bacterium]|nr:atpH [Candidatus Saccharibacteria bacterium]